MRWFIFINVLCLNYTLTLGCRFTSWVEVLLSMGAQCDQVSNLKVFVRKCEFSLLYCRDAVFLNGIHLG